MWIIVKPGFGIDDANIIQKLYGAFASVACVNLQMCLNGLKKLLANCHHWVQRGLRVLKDEANTLAAERADLGGWISQIESLQLDVASLDFPRFIQQPQESPGQWCSCRTLTHRQGPGFLPFLTEKLTSCTAATNSRRVG